MGKNKGKSLARVDLNLLVTLDLLLRERNVTQAAQAMFVSQSAMSRSLQRLRDTFDDPLFSRTAKGLVPTSKALELEKELSQILPLLTRLFEQSEFDPGQCDNTFAVAVPSFVGSLMIPGLLLQILEISPRASLVEVPAKSNPFDLLDSGKLDFAVYYTPQQDKKYRAEHIGTIYPELLVRKDHPLVGQNPSLDQVMEFPFVSMAIEEDHKQAFNTPLQKLLNQWETQSSPKLRSTQTQVLFEVASRSDAIIFGMNALKSMPEFEQNYVSIYSFQDQLEFHVELFLLQHQRSFTSMPHQWFATLLKEHLVRQLQH